MAEYDKGFFGPFHEFLIDDSITDIDAREGVIFTTDKDSCRIRHERKELDTAFLSAFSMRVANKVSLPFNKESPVLEADTDTLRITIVHPSVSKGSAAVSIRKSLPILRLDEKTMIKSGFATEKVFALLKACVKAHMNFVFIGEPGAGKTECAKFFSTFINRDERVITIEDNPEWHYSSLCPGRDSVEIKIGKTLDYSAAIKTSMRLNPRWMMLSEARGREVKRLLEGFSTGVHGMTTLHADDVSKIPDRMLNMAGDVPDERRFLNNVYEFIDLGILIKRKRDKDGKVFRCIDEIGFFSREEDKNVLNIVFEDMRFTGEKPAARIMKKLKEAGAKETEDFFSSGDDDFSFARDTILVSTGGNETEDQDLKELRMNEIRRELMALTAQRRCRIGKKTAAVR